jgi:HAD superfamily hydrolase (TIGR01662 family)
VTDPIPISTDSVSPDRTEAASDRRYSIVIPSIGRPSLDTLLGQLAVVTGPAPELVVIADDRRFDPVDNTAPEPLQLKSLPWPVRVVRTGGRGPAAARNAGWRATRTTWVAFLDDDVEVSPDWSERLVDDIACAGPTVGGVQATLRVPLPVDRQPTDWERNTAGLQQAAWITADMVYRRAALVAVDGFDERFPRAYREDADLALRVRRDGWQLIKGRRCTTHPVRPADDWVSVRVQAGAADDVLMRALHGRTWRSDAETGHGRFRWHLVTVSAAAAAMIALFVGRRGWATVAFAGWIALAADFLYRRLAPGPRPGDVVYGAELRRMAVTSVVIPFAALRHRWRGIRRYGRSAPSWPPPITAVLFDRDGTLVHDEPYNGDPDKVRVVDGAREVLDDLRERGIAVGVISNQSGVGRGLLTADQVVAVNRRIEHTLGPFDVWQFCPHIAEDLCTCRKPLPGMVLAAAAELNTPSFQCAVIGDIEADVLAAEAAGALGILVPTKVTRVDEVSRSTFVADTLADAVEAVLTARSCDARRVREQPEAAMEPSGAAA